MSLYLSLELVPRIFTAMLKLGDSLYGTGCSDPPHLQSSYSNQE